MKIHIYIIADDTFLPGCLVLLSSITEYEQFTDFTCTVLYDSKISLLSESSKIAISKVYPKVAFLEICNDLYRAFPVEKPMSNLSLLKFEIFNTQGDQLSIYIDSDMIVVAKNAITDFVSILISSRCWIAGVENKSLCTLPREYEFQTFPMNAGFFGVKDNLPRKLEIYNSLLKEVRKCNSDGVKKFMICQPILNKVFADFQLSYLSAPVFYNVKLPRIYNKFKDDAKLLHYVSRTSDLDKPWNEDINLTAPDRQEFVSPWQRRFLSMRQ